MNILDARTQIEQIIQMYLEKDKDGQYLIPIHRQRPIFMIGAPGIGKTAIVSQIASKLHLALVSYSMSHHTRQSALGLPFIKEEIYAGKSHHITEYTMSEIIASMYDAMRMSNLKEGILFLDEINCVSETLAPAMLQFLQYKVFGRHAVPEGWVIVTAGNPSAYNRTVKDFDIATLDRLRVLTIEEDYGTWRLYAKSVGIHPSIIGFLDIKKQYFYHIESTVDGKSYVTARGWEDLSETLYLYEKFGFAVHRSVIEPIIHHEQIAREFHSYYDLHQLYCQKYAIDDILSGSAPNSMLKRAKEAAFDERLALIGLLTSDLQSRAQLLTAQSDFLSYLHPLLADILSSQESIIMALQSLQEQEKENFSASRSANSDNDALITRQRHTLSFLDSCLSIGQNCDSHSVRSAFQKEVETRDNLANHLSAGIDHAYAFCEAAYGDGDALLILTTELSLHPDTASFITEFSPNVVLQHQKKLAFENKYHDLQTAARQQL